MTTPLQKANMHAILIHGMGRTPTAMSILAARLRAAGIRPHLFGDSVTFERWDACIQRLEHFITKRVKTNEYIIGYSLGSILTRAMLPGLIHPVVSQDMVNIVKSPSTINP